MPLTIEISFKRGRQLPHALVDLAPAVPAPLLQFACIRPALESPVLVVLVFDIQKIGSGLVLLQLGVGCGTPDDAHGWGRRGLAVLLRRKGVPSLLGLLETCKDSPDAILNGAQSVGALPNALALVGLVDILVEKTELLNVHRGGVRVLEDCWGSCCSCIYIRCRCLGHPVRLLAGVVQSSRYHRGKGHE